MGTQVYGFQDIRKLTVRNGTFNFVGGSQHNHYKKAYSEPTDELANWFSSINFRHTQNDTFMKHTPGTCRWLLESDDFDGWTVSRHDQVLWVTGMPGAGKTILSSIVVNHLQNRFQLAPDVAILFAFCRHKDKNSEADIFAALLRQLVDSTTNTSVLSEARSFYEHYKRVRVTPTSFSLLALLQSLCRYFRIVLITLDALDELSDKVKEAVLIGLSRLRANKFITSRPLESFKSLLPNVNSCRMEHSLINNKDIEHFILTKLATIPRLWDICGGSQDLTKAICRKLKEKSAGMFLVSSLQIELLRRTTTRKKLWDALESLPSGVSDMYESTWQRIKSQTQEEFDLARRSIVWLLFAKRPLSSIELRKAMGISNDTCHYHEDDLPSEDLLVTVCSGLITIDTTNGMARLTHYTAYDFFKELGPELWPNPHTFLAVSCLTYLTTLGFPEKFLDERSLFNQYANPLFGYAYEHWGSHAQDGENEELFQDGVLGLLDGWSHYPSIDPNLNFNFDLPVDRMDLSHTTLQPQRDRYPNFDIIELPHVVSRYGFRQCIPLLLLSKDKKTQQGWTPLHVAAAYGQLTVCQTLLAHSTDINPRTSNNYTPLLVASLANQPGILQLFLSQPSLDVNISTNNGLSALIAASYLGYREIVHSLLSHPEVDVNTYDESGKTPLIHASIEGHVGIVKLLLSHRDLDVNRQDRKGMTALARAVFLDLVDTSLASNNTEAGSNFGAACEYTEITNLLLSHHAIDVNKKDGTGATPLFYASFRGKQETVKRLLSFPDIDVNGQDEEGRTPLIQASLRGYSKTIQLLLSNAAVDANVQDEDGMSAIAYAARDGFINALKTLISTDNIDVNTQDTEQRTALIHACVLGRVEVVDILLSHPTIDVNLPDDKGMTALAYASRDGYLDIVKLLLSHREINVNIRDRESKTALSHASSHFGRTEIIQLLLSRFEINVQDGETSPARPRSTSSGPSLASLESLYGPMSQLGISKEDRATILSPRVSERRHARIGLKMPRWLKPKGKKRGRPDAP